VPVGRVFACHRWPWPLPAAGYNSHGPGRHRPSSSSRRLVLLGVSGSVVMMTSSLGPYVQNFLPSPPDFGLTDEHAVSDMLALPPLRKRKVIGSPVVRSDLRVGPVLISGF